MKHDHETQLHWRVHDIRDETAQVRTLFLKPEGDMPQFIPGQYLTVFLEGHEPVAGKCYSITSIPSDPHLSITIKTLGPFSQRLTRSTTGSSLTTSSPYGFFFPDETEIERPIVCIAGGIGIAPCMSIITALAEQKHHTPYRLLYANRTIADIVFKDALNTIAETNSSFRVTHWISREAVCAPNMIEGRMDRETLSATVQDLKHPLYFICGSAPFTRALFTILRSLGVPHTNLYTEGFY